MSSDAAFVMPVVRGEVEAFDPIRISPSRVNAYLQCGVAFKRKYVDGEQPKVIGSAALFGNVMHAAAEKWALNREQDLVSLTAQAWLDQTKGTPVASFIGQYQSLSIEAMKAEKEARTAWEKANPGKTSKAPRMTKFYKESKVAKDIDTLLRSWLPKLNQSEWRFTERDPLPNLYDESLVLAKRYRAKWSSLPTALNTEFGFTVEWRGFILRGFIDAICPVVAPTGELAGYSIEDYKTYRAEAPLAKDWRQGVIYDVAFEALCKSGALPYDPDEARWIVFDYMRLLARKDYRMAEADREQLFEDLTMYRTAVEAGVFLPAHKGTNPDFCDYPEDCCMKTRGSGTSCRGGLYPEATK